jgi:hypothetical protein
MIGVKALLDGTLGRRLPAYLGKFAVAEPG